MSSTQAKSKVEIQLPDLALRLLDAEDTPECQRGYRKTLQQGAGRDDKRTQSQVTGLGQLSYPSARRAQTNEETQRLRARAITNLPETEV